MALTSIEITLSIILALSIAAIIFLYLKFSKSNQAYEQLTKGVSPGNLEELLKQYIIKIDIQKEQIAKIEDKLESFMDSSKHHLQKVGFKRFNPFDQTGGDQSFVIVLLDKVNSGIVISSLHQREVTRVYAKEVLRGTCKYKLSKEEEEVLKETISK